jgi:transposase
MLVVEAQGLPIGFHLDSASPAEMTLAKMTLQTVRVRSHKGQVKTRPRQLVADRGYAAGEFRRTLQQRGIKVCIPAKKRPARWRKKRGRPWATDKEAYKQRFKVERSFSWMGNFRRLLIRWEHHLSVYRGFCLFALALICINKLLK